jgi:hypothetical protein
MELQLNNDRLAQSLYRKNLLDAIAKSSIKYTFFHKDVKTLEDSYIQAQERRK